MGLNIYGQPVLPVVESAFSDSAADQTVAVINTWENLLMNAGTPVDVTIGTSGTYLPHYPYIFQTNGSGNKAVPG